jgi:hypothetical protein
MALIEDSDDITQVAWSASVVWTDSTGMDNLADIYGSLFINGGFNEFCLEAAVVPGALGKVEPPITRGNYTVIGFTWSSFVDGVFTDEEIANVIEEG